MSLGCFINNNSWEELTFKKFALSSLAGWDYNRYTIDNLFFYPLLDCHEVMELALFNSTDSFSGISHKSPFVSIRKPLLIEFKDVLTFNLLYLLFLILFWIIIILALFRLRLFAMNLALWLDANEFWRLFFRYFIFAFFFFLFLWVIILFNIILISYFNSSSIVVIFFLIIINHYDFKFLS